MALALVAVAGTVVVTLLPVERGIRIGRSVLARAVMPLRVEAKSAELRDLEIRRRIPGGRKKLQPAQADGQQKHNERGAEQDHEGHGVSLHDEQKPAVEVVHSSPSRVVSSS